MNELKDKHRLTDTYLDKVVEQYSFSCPGHPQYSIYLRYYNQRRHSYGYVFYTPGHMSLDTPTTNPTQPNRRL